ncbi:MAG: hypothetical protein HY897_21720, partial [Deltaproteobacteria bacterium]|nr:hypothetical protein [Deltaproteobacteria bacterium]
MTKAAIACALFGITMAATASAQGAEKAVNPVPAALPNPDAPADAAGDTA